MKVSERIKNSIYLFTLVFLAVYAVKPRFLFNEQKKRRPFGVGFTKDGARERKTLFDFTVFIVLVSFVLASIV
jgi:hypothetical protein